MRKIHCTCCGQEGEAIQTSVYGGAVGTEILEKVCEPCWQAWYAQSIKIINEYRLNLRDPPARDFLSAQMKLFLKLSSATLSEEAQPSPQR